MRNQKIPRQTKNPNKWEYKEYTLLEMFCLMSAWSGQPLESVLRWKIPHFIKMWKTYNKEKYNNQKW